MKICFVGPAISSHIEKWCEWFSRNGHEVHVITFTPRDIRTAEIHQIDVSTSVVDSDIRKMAYLFTAGKIRRIINKINPDVINVHYATSYGIPTALSGIKGYVLSVWGSDIYDFPKKSPFHRALLKLSLKKADLLFATSHALAKEANKYTDKEFVITPFGVDMDLFNPDKRIRITDKPFTVGIVKLLTELYGIEYLLRAVAIVKNQITNIDMVVRICGDGPDRGLFEKMAKDMGIDDITYFTGMISQDEVAVELANMDLAIIPSVLYESFCVTAVEAQACGIPVIVSEVDGLMETTVPGKTSIVVPKRNERAIADEIIRLYNDPDLRRRMGTEGRENAVEKYELNRCFRNIETALIEYAENNKNMP